MKITKPIDYKVVRQAAYKPLSDQVDLIVKTFAFLRLQGVDVGADGDQLISDSLAVKTKFKKSGNKPV